MACLIYGILGFVVVSLWLGGYFSGRIVYWFKIEPDDEVRCLGFWCDIYKLLRILFWNNILRLIGEKNYFRVDLLTLVTTKDETYKYYGIQGRWVGYFERSLFTILYVIIDNGKESTLGALAVGWLLLKATTYWIPLVTLRSGNSRIFKKSKKLSYAPFMATIISLLFALLGGMIIENWAGINK